MTPPAVHDGGVPFIPAGHVHGGQCLPRAVRAGTGLYATRYTPIRYMAGGVSPSHWEWAEEKVLILGVEAGTCLALN